MIIKAVPLLPAHNSRDTILFYEMKLGFTAKDHGDFIIMHLGGVVLHFYLTQDPDHFNNSGCYIYVSNIEDFFSRLSSLDILKPKDKLEIKPGGRKEFSVVDNNGNLLRFGEEK